MKRRLLAVILAGAMVCSLAACGNKESGQDPKETENGAEAEAETEAGEKITLKFWDMVWGGSEYAAEAEKLAKSYTEVVPNVEIEYQSIPWANRYETFSVAVASGDGPDVSTGGGYQQHQFAATDNILPLNDIIEEWEADGKLDDFMGGMVEFFQDSEGNQLGIPFNIDPRGIFYRKDLFKEKGIEPPETWEELYAAIEQFSDPDNDMYGLVYPAADSNANVSFVSWLVSNGGGVWKEDGKTPDWTSESNQQTLDFIASIRDAGYFPEGMASYEQPDSQRMFLQGKAAMVIDSIGFGTQIQAQGDEFVEKVGIIDFPQGPSASEPAMATAMNAYMVYSSTEYPEESKEFIKWWSENNLSLWTGKAQCGSPPARLSFLNDETYTSNELNPFMGEMVETWVPVMKHTMYPATAANLVQNTLDGERWWRDVSQAVLVGEKSTADILQEKQKAAEALIEDIGLE